MKISLALGPRQPLSRQTAWGCFTSNVALPGSGSLLAGRVSGYFQMALAFVGLGLSLVFGARAAIWLLANTHALQDPEADPISSLERIWFAIRWALFGMFVFIGGWLWSCATGLNLLREAREHESRVPPKLT